MDTDALNNLIDERLKKQLQAGLFTSRKVGDTPTDSYALVPRGYANMNGSVASRPNSSVATIGQRFFASDTKITMTFDGNNWYNGVGSMVAQN